MDDMLPYEGIYTYRYECKIMLAASIINFVQHAGNE